MVKISGPARTVLNFSSTNPKATSSIPNSPWSSGPASSTDSVHRFTTIWGQRASKPFFSPRTTPLADAAAAARGELSPCHPLPPPSHATIASAATMTSHGCTRTCSPRPASRRHCISGCTANSPTRCSTAGRALRWSPAREGGNVASCSPPRPL